MLKFIPLKIQLGITGFESPCAEYSQLGLDLDSLLIDKPSSTYIGLAQGRSMEGVGIYDGDLIIVDRSLAVTDNSIIVCNLNSEFTCKILNTKNQTLISAKIDGIETYKLTSSDEFQIEGVVTRSIRIHKPLGMLCTA